MNRYFGSPKSFIVLVCEYALFDAYSFIIHCAIPCVVELEEVNIDCTLIAEKFWL